MRLPPQDPPAGDYGEKTTGPAERPEMNGGATRDAWHRELRRARPGHGSIACHP